MSYILETSIGELFVNSARKSKEVESNELVGLAKRLSLWRLKHNSRQILAAPIFFYQGELHLGEVNYGENPYVVAGEKGSIGALYSFPNKNNWNPLDELSSFLTEKQAILVYVHEDTKRLEALIKSPELLNAFKKGEINKDDIWNRCYGRGFDSIVLQSRIILLGAFRRNINSSRLDVLGDRLRDIGVVVVEGKLSSNILRVLN